VGIAFGSSTSESFTLVEMWDGTTWSVVPSPEPSTASTPFNRLSGVSCISTTSCTAAGDYRTNIESKTLLASWDGTTWSVDPSPDASSADSLSSISCVSISSCTAVGSYNNGSVNQTLIEVLKGTSWSVVSSPNSSTSDTNVLDGVSCPTATSGTCTAVGFFEKGNGLGPAQTLITHDVPLS
jgi:hypothetical protein